MPEPDLSDSLSDEIEQAYYVENDPAKANLLYAKQLGRDDGEGEQLPSPQVPEVVQDEGKGAAEPEDTGPRPSDIENMGGGGMNDYEPYDQLSEDQKDERFESMMALSDPDTSKGILQAEMPGAEFARNVELADAALRANPHGAKVLMLLEAVGISDHPDIVRFIMHEGRALASKPGDPATIPTTMIEGKKMTDVRAIQAEIDTLEVEIDKATAQGDSIEAQEMFARQQNLYRQLPGGDGPIVDGRRTL